MWVQLVSCYICLLSSHCIFCVPCLSIMNHGAFKQRSGANYTQYIEYTIIPPISMYLLCSHGSCLYDLRVIEDVLFCISFFAFFQRLTQTINGIIFELSSWATGVFICFEYCIFRKVDSNHYLFICWGQILFRLTLRPFVGNISIVFNRARDHVIFSSIPCNNGLSVYFQRTAW